jgi:hypothetical protein
LRTKRFVEGVTTPPEDEDGTMIEIDAKTAEAIDKLARNVVRERDPAKRFTLKVAAEGCIHIVAADRLANYPELKTEFVQAHVEKLRNKIFELQLAPLASQ